MTRLGHKQRIKKEDAVCFWCGQKAYWWSKRAARYCCSKVYKDCPTYIKMIEHKESCPLPDSYHTIDSISTIKCAGLLYEIYASKPITIIYKLENLMIRYRIQLGTEPCKYCGEPAKFYKSGLGCCTEKSTDCPNYHKWVGDRFRQKYIDRPELLEKMSAALKISQNRPEVKAAKSKAMKHLHRDDCDKCEDFRRRYFRKVGRKKKNAEL